MAWESLKQIIETIEQQPAWQKQQQFRQLLQAWEQIIEPPAAAHCRPYALDRQILWVATANAAWAQNLSLQRSRLLKRLNQLLEEPVKQLRFSPAHWTEKREIAASFSQVSAVTNLESAPYSDEALNNFKQAISAKNSAFPECPQCHCPTPPKELERWSVCGFCILQYWK